MANKNGYFTSIAEARAAGCKIIRQTSYTAIDRKGGWRGTIMGCATSEEYTEDLEQKDHSA